MVVVLKELPTRPTVHIPPNSRHGDALWSLLKRCWVNEPEDRPKASEVAKIMREFRRPSMAEKEGLSKPEQRLQEGATTKWHGFWAGAMLRLGNSTRKPGLSRNPNNSSPASSSSGNTGAKGSLGGAPAPAPAPVTSPSLPPISLRLELEIWVAALKAYDEEDYGKSLETFGRIANSAKILTNIGLIHATVGEHEAAVQRFREAVSLDQYLAVAYFQCGVSNFLLDRYDEAHGDFDDALLYLRDNQFINYEQVGLRFRLYSAEILFNRGLCQIFMGRLDIGLQDMREAQKAKVTKEHNVFDDAILERGEGYTVFSIPVGVLYRPSESKLKNAKAKGFLGGAQLITSPDAKDTVTTSTGTTGLQRRERVSEWRGGYDKRYAG
ncbi:hypothetical protein FS749_007879 [Ceratobasidium sp. UAMH 11750]|nr:hypothetical protein FS749_007879 [Ceratobasidium sp. UAMH 11750]